MKYVVLLIVLVVAYSLWRNARIERKRERDAAAPPARGPAAGPQEMVRCAVCAVHLPRGDALTGPDGQHYCSQEHRRIAG